MDRFILTLWRFAKGLFRFLGIVLLILLGVTVLVGVVVAAAWVLRLTAYAFIGWLGTLGFWWEFSFLTLGYLAIAMGVVVVLARIKDLDPADVAMNNNTWFFTVLGMAVITSVVAWFMWGPPLLLPSDWPAAETLTKVKDVGNHILFGNTAGAVEPVKALPWAGGTWFFWKAAGLYWLLTFIMIPISFYDELEEAVKAAGRAWDRRRLRLAAERAAAATKTAEAKAREEHRRSGKKGPPPPVLPATPEPEKITFMDLLRAEIIGEVGMEFLMKLVAAIWRNRRAAA